MTLLPMMYSLIPLTVYLRNPSDVALDVRLCQQMDTKNMGNDEKELPIRQCTTSSALPPKAVSATKQCVIHIWKGRPSAGRVPAASRPATGSKGARNSSFFLLSMYAKDREVKGWQDLTQKVIHISIVLLKRVGI